MLEQTGNVNPFSFFEAIYCINLDRNTERWERVSAQAQVLGFAHRLRRFPAIETPDNHHVGCALSHRAILKIAYALRYDNVLVLEDDVVFRGDTLTRLKENVEELQGKQWDLLYLGGHRWGRPYLPSEGCETLLEVGLSERTSNGPTCTHALAYHHHCYAEIFNILPNDPQLMHDFLREVLPGIDHVYAYNAKLRRFICEPHVATQAPLLKQEDAAFRGIISELPAA